MAKREKSLHAVRPNVGVEMAYRRKLRALIEEMARSYQRHVAAQYRASEPRMAQDETPAAELERLLRRLGNQWRKRFDETAKEAASRFARQSAGASDAVLRRMLKKAGFTVPFKMTPAMRDVLDATVAENVGLIRSIPAKYHVDVQGAVMRSVQRGRDLHSLSTELRKAYGVSYRRAALIARDQNNKATSSMMAARQTSLGIEQGVWLHSHAGKEPRPTHLANHGKKFSVAEGWFDPDPRVRKRILPGELINCRCTWRPVVPGLT